MKITITSDFDLQKLIDNFDSKINPKISELTAKDTAKQWKANIDNRVKPPLRNSTLNIRKENNISGDLPLKATGKLYNSIRADKNQVKYEGYGDDHQKGYTVFFRGKNREVPAREWQSEPSVTEKTKEEAIKLIKKEIKVGKKVLFKSQ